MQQTRSQQLLLAYDFPPMGGGIARWMDAMARHYPPDRLTVSTGSVEGAAHFGGSWPQHVDRIATPSERLRTLPGQLQWTRRALELAQPGAVRFIWCDSVRPAGYVARWINQRQRVPYGIIVHGGDLLTLRARLNSNPIKRKMLRSILQHAAVFVANSRWTAALCADVLREQSLEDGAAIRTIPLGTDPERWQATPDDVAAFRSRRGLPDGEWMLTVSRLVDYKGIDTALRVLHLLAATHPGLRYAVVGRGEYRAQLQSLAGALGISDRVHFIDDVQDAELPAAYAMANLYVGLTRESAFDVEGFGISFAEAAASGLPAVASRSGGIPDAVVDGETGILVDPDDVEQAAGAVSRLLEDRALATRLGTAARSRVVGYLNWSRVVSDMIAVSDEFAAR